MSYENNVYKITVNDTGKKYIGYHKGKFDGTYHPFKQISSFLLGTLEVTTRLTVLLSVNIDD